MIAGETATGLIEALRAVVRTGRALKQDDHQAAAAVLAGLSRGGEQRLGQLACGLAVDPSVVSRQVAGLTRAGLVARRPDPGDGRAGLLSLTDRGADWLAAHRRKEADRLVGLLAGWSEDDVGCLLGYLRKLNDDIGKEQHR
ncbi:MarR family winged helix-turn-helix transcriptional regulator [Actinokineospora diospyrosa]|uniref:DNA-binding transcriptional regulator, MarR family n=1 Tax=Actinokineospora diospyrosa TaxID=103728 RepID=A0ABT1I554_9PSEU|nr:MarR family transcriptional regulator [Actinokineospora diospyrosa]MCP2267758.1 DNA-binding transcriptional regulator, MarR family [Actinokineospora diospyrosa]